MAVPRRPVPGRAPLRRAAFTAVVVMLALAAGCAGDNDPPPPVSSPVNAPMSTEPSPNPSGVSPGPDDAPATPSNDQARNDLAQSSAQHVIKVSGLTVNATYSPRVPVAAWTASANKPLALTLTTVNNRKAGQKIYLTRVTVTITARDESGPLDSPRPLVDTANITPGFIVTFPYTYGQDFVVPALDEGATSVTLDFTYEFLLQVSKDSRDYYKQTAIDTVVAPIAG